MQSRILLQGAVLLLFLLGFPGQGLASPVSLTVTDADVRTVLAGLARSSGRAIVLDGSVQGTISMEMSDIEAEDAFRMIADAKGLLLEERGGVLLIRAADGNTSGLRRVHVLAAHYADPEIVAKALNLSLGKEGFSPDSQNKNKAQDFTKSDQDGAAEPKGASRAFVDKSTNSLLFYGTDREAAEAQKLLHKLDAPMPQVSLEAKVVAIQTDAAKELGVTWEWSNAPQYPDFEEESRTVRRSVTAEDGTSYAITGTEPHYRLKRHAEQFENGGVPGILQFGRGPEGLPYEWYYSAKLHALISDGKAKLLARPNVVTLPGHEAKINIGGDVPVPTVRTTDRETTTSYEYKQAGIILRCTPVVNDDGHVTAKVHTEVSSPLYVEAMNAYRFQKREADTLVRLADGETMVIGGLMGSEEARSLSKVPFLGDLPVLGAFFRNVRTSKTDTEIMIFLTAHILPEKSN